MKTILLLGLIILSACTTPKRIVQESALLNAHDYKYGYIIDGKTYKTDVQLNIGDTVSPAQLDKFLIIK